MYLFGLTFGFWTLLEPRSSTHISRADPWSPWVGWVAFFLDTEGNRICMQQDG